MLILFLPLSAFADTECESELKIAETYAGMFGGVVGTIYGIAISQDNPEFCLPEVLDGEMFNLIGAVLKSKPQEIGLMPTKESALKFLVQNFPCKGVE